MELKIESHAMANKKASQVFIFAIAKRALCRSAVGMYYKQQTTP